MKSKYFLILLNIFLLALIALTLLWEWQITPIRQGGSWLMLKALPLSLFVSGCLKGHKRTMQKLSLLVPFYMAEGIMRLNDLSLISRYCAVAEIVLSVALFASTMAFFYLRKKEIRQKDSCKTVR